MIDAVRIEVYTAKSELRTKIKASISNLHREIVASISKLSIEIDVISAILVTFSTQLKWV